MSPFCPCAHTNPFITVNTCTHVHTYTHTCTHTRAHTDSGCVHISRDASPRPPPVLERRCLTITDALLYSLCHVINVEGGGTWGGAAMRRTREEEGGGREREEEGGRGGGGGRRKRKRGGGGRRKGLQPVDAAQGGKPPHGNQHPDTFVTFMPN